MSHSRSNPSLFHTTVSLTHSFLHGRQISYRNLTTQSGKHPLHQEVEQIVNLQRHLVSWIVAPPRNPSFMIRLMTKITAIQQAIETQRTTSSWIRNLFIDLTEGSDEKKLQDLSETWNLCKRIFFSILRKEIFFIKNGRRYSKRLNKSFQHIEKTILTIQPHDMRLLEMLWQCKSHSHSFMSFLLTCAHSHSDVGNTLAQDYKQSFLLFRRSYLMACDQHNLIKTSQIIHKQVHAIEKLFEELCVW